MSANQLSLLTRTQCYTHHNKSAKKGLRPSVRTAQTNGRPYRNVKFGEQFFLALVTKHPGFRAKRSRFKVTYEPVEYCRIDTALFHFASTAYVTITEST